MSAERPRPGLAGDEAGATALEFALLAPVFIALLFGVFQLGWALHCGATLQYAVEQAARTVMLDATTTEAELQTEVRATMAAMAADEDDVTVSLAFQTTNGVSMAKVSAAYTQQVGVPHLATYDMTFTPEVLVPAS